MELSDVLNNATDQDKGAALDLIAPWDGKPTGMVFTIAGPDSDTARRVIAWDVKEEGKPVPFDTRNVLKLLSVAWVREQIDAFAGDHRHFGPKV